MLKIQSVKESIAQTGKNTQAPLKNLPFGIWMLGVFSEIFENLYFLAFPYMLTAILYSIQSSLSALYYTDTSCNIHVLHTHAHTNCEVKAIKIPESTGLGLWNR